MQDDFYRSALPESSLSMLIAAARRHVKHAIAGILEPYGMNAYHCWMILLLRDRGPMSLSELAGRMWMDHPTASRLVHALQESGLLLIQPDPAHGRRVLITINAEKASLVEEIHTKVTSYRTKVERGLSSEEKTSLHSGLAKVILNLSDMLEEGTGTKGNLRRRAKGKAQAD